MDTQPSLTTATPTTTPTGSKFFARPSSKLGWWSLGLAGLCLLAIATLVSGAFKHAATHAPMKTCGGIMVLSGVAAGVTALLAMVRRRERSWLVVFPLVIGVLFFLIVIVELVFRPV